MLGIGEVRVETVIAVGEIGVRRTNRLLKYAFVTERSHRETDAEDPHKNKSITLLIHDMKLLDRIADGKIRKRVEQELGEENQEFRKKDNGWNVSRRYLIDKMLDKQGNVALGFVDLEKAFDNVSREMVVATVKWLEVPEAEERTVKATCERTREE